jgi:predicted metal-dependent HD superfamily phosphohydrolase
MNSLYPRWQTLLPGIAQGSDAGRQSFLDLTHRYSGAERFYHNLQHLTQVLDLIDQLASFAVDLPAVRLAAWFHDAVYDSRASDNEEKSAELAVGVLKDLSIPPATLTTVERLILCTKRHQADPDDWDAHLLLDADLAILGAEVPEYQLYASAIRQEYSWVAEADYRIGRARVLRHFLQRPAIYFTKSMIESREVEARSNLQREILMLS